LKTSENQCKTHTLKHTSFNLSFLLFVDVECVVICCLNTKIPFIKKKYLSNRIQNVIRFYGNECNNNHNRCDNPTTVLALRYGSVLWEVCKNIQVDLVILCICDCKLNIFLKHIPQFKVLLDLFICEFITNFCPYFRIQLGSQFFTIFSFYVMF
jgi:hypothetical protein